MKKIYLSIALFVFVSMNVMAQAPQSFNYQGVARDISGAPMASVPIGLRLSIHNSSPTGPIVYQESQLPSTNTFGLYTAAIGAGTVLSGTFNTINWGGGSKFLEVEIDPAGGTSYTSAGTSQLLSVPYSVYANNANNANNVNMAGDVTGTNAAANVVKLQGNAVSTSVPTAGQVLQWVSGNWTPATVSFPTVSGTTNYISKFTGPSALGNSMVYDNGTSVGIGTTTPTATNVLQVLNTSTLTNAHAVHGIAGAPATGSIVPASGVYGESFSGVGVAGVSASNGGVMGYTTSSASAGVEGYSSTAGGAGVYGSSTGAGGVGGQFDGGTTGYGVLVTGGNSGFGTLTPTASAIVEVSGVGTAGTGVYTQAGIVADGATTLNASGIFGQGGWRGVYGYNDGSAGGSQAIGVQGTVATGSSYTNGTGVYGSALGGGGTNFGIYGTASGAGVNYAGYFAGNVTVSGSLSKGSGTFKIDHPLDPENKYLYHSFVESPDMMNIYNGNITTDGSGNAEVILPDYFDALNKDYRYQLTVIGTFAQAMISKKVSGNKFSIKTNAPNVEVSWQVTGVRQDKFANAHRVVPEVAKEAENKGLYIHAAEWGMSEAKSINNHISPAGITSNGTPPPVSPQVMQQGRKKAANQVSEQKGK